MFFLVVLFLLGFFSQSWSGWRCLVGSFRACAFDRRAAPLVFEGGLGRTWRRRRVHFGLLQKCMIPTQCQLLRPPESETTRLRLLRWPNFTRQSALGRTGHKIAQWWTRRKLHLQHATVHHCRSIPEKKCQSVIPKCWWMATFPVGLKTNANYGDENCYIAYSHQSCRTVIEATAGNKHLLVFS